LHKRSRRRIGKEEVEDAIGLLDSAIDRDQVIVLESELLESRVNRQSRERLARMREEAIESADTLRKVLVYIRPEAEIDS
jgi:hypothetical protein